MPKEVPPHSALEHYRAALREMRAKFDGTASPPLAPHDLHRWVSWLSEVEWYLSRVAEARDV